MLNVRVHRKKKNNKSRQHHTRSDSITVSLHVLWLTNFLHWDAIGQTTGRIAVTCKRMSFLSSSSVTPISVEYKQTRGTHKWQQRATTRCPLDESEDDELLLLLINTNEKRDTTFENSAKTAYIRVVTRNEWTWTNQKILKNKTKTNFILREFQTTGQPSK
jgi:hypothetical protein